MALKALEGFKKEKKKKSVNKSNLDHGTVHVNKSMDEEWKTPEKVFPRSVNRNRNDKEIVHTENSLEVLSDENDEVCDNDHCEEKDSQHNTDEKIESEGSKKNENFGSGPTREILLNENNNLKKVISIKNESMQLLLNHKEVSTKKLMNQSTLEKFMKRAAKMIKVYCRVYFGLVTTNYGEMKILTFMLV